VTVRGSFVRPSDGRLDPRELEQLAAAAGVAPATVRRAVAAVEARAGKRRFVAEARRRRFQLALVAHVLASAVDTTA
jgi:hypothetical protein